MIFGGHILFSAERQGNEPISLCRFNSTLYQYVNALGGYNLGFKKDVCLSSFGCSLSA